MLIILILKFFRRVISFNVLTLCFKFFPRNRIISNTFKMRRNSSTTVTKSSVSSGGFNNLNPVIEESERESAKHKNKFEGLVEFPEGLTEEISFKEQRRMDHNQCFSTPSKSKKNLYFSFFFKF